MLRVFEIKPFLYDWTSQIEIEFIHSLSIFHSETITTSGDRKEMKELLQ